MGYSYIPANIFVRGTSGNSPGTSYKEKKKISKNTSQAAPGALTHRLQCRTPCKIQNGCSCQLLLIKFLDPSTPSMRKGRDGCSVGLYAVRSGVLYSIQEGYMDAQEGCILFRGVTCCSVGLYAVQVGYMDVQEGCILFRGIICCSGGLYTVQEGYMDA